MRAHSPVEVTCDFCGKNEKNPNNIGSGGFAWQSCRRNWAQIVETVEIGCPEEGRPFEIETRHYDICNECLDVMSRHAMKKRLEKYQPSA
jgi:hypothetical protein